MKMNGYYSEKSNDASTSRVQVDVDKIQVSIETKCPVCQDHHDILGLTCLLYTSPSPRDTR